MLNLSEIMEKANQGDIIINYEMNGGHFITFFDNNFYYCKDLYFQDMIKIALQPSDFLSNNWVFIDFAQLEHYYDVFDQSFNDEKIT